MYTDLKVIEEKMSEIKRVLELIKESLPLKNDEIENIFSRLTGCSIDLYSYVDKISSIDVSDRHEILVLVIDSIVECSKLGEKQVFKATLRTIEVYDKEKIGSITVNMKLLDIRPEW
jgi:uncharacterized tellurite resistance protein B-like protein